MKFLGRGQEALWEVIRSSAFKSNTKTKREKKSVGMSRGGGVYYAVSLGLVEKKKRKQGGKEKCAEKSKKARERAREEAPLAFGGEGDNSFDRDRASGKGGGEIKQVL